MAWVGHVLNKLLVTILDFIQNIQWEAFSLIVNSSS